MTLHDALLRSMPNAAFKLYKYGDAYGDIYVDYYGVGGYVDITGNGHTLTGAMSFVSPIINGNSDALFVNTATMMSTETKAFIRGSENNSFSLEEWVLPTTFGANVSILSHTGIYDGLYFDGNFINFKINFSTLGSCLLYTSPSPRDRTRSRMPSSA